MFSTGDVRFGVDSLSILRFRAFCACRAYLSSLPSPVEGGLVTCCAPWFAVSMACLCFSTADVVVVATRYVQGLFEHLRTRSSRTACLLLPHLLLRTSRPGGHLLQGICPLNSASIISVAGEHIPVTFLGKRYMGKKAAAQASASPPAHGSLLVPCETCRPLLCRLFYTSYTLPSFRIVTW